jgi:hypothetical protein
LLLNLCLDERRQAHIWDITSHWPSFLWFALLIVSHLALDSRSGVGENCTVMTSPANPRTFQMPGHGWAMVKRIVRAYGAAQNDDNASVDSVAKLAGIHRPVVSANNNFLRSIGVLDLEKPKLTPLGMKLSTGIGLGNAAIVTEALQEVVHTTPILAQLENILRARGTMDAAAFRGQAILAAGLTDNSANLPMVKTLIDLLEESKLIEIRDGKIFLGGTPLVNDNGAMQPGTTYPPTPTPALPPAAAGVSTTVQNPNISTAAWADLLLAKFPEFDPSWTDDVKLKWFDAFDRLMKGRGI